MTICRHGRPLPSPVRLGATIAPAVRLKAVTFATPARILVRCPKLSMSALARRLTPTLDTSETTLAPPPRTPPEAPHSPLTRSKGATSGGAKGSSASEVLMEAWPPQCTPSVSNRSATPERWGQLRIVVTASERRVKSVTLRIVIGLMGRVLLLLVFLLLACQKSKSGTKKSQ